MIVSYKTIALWPRKLKGDRMIDNTYPVKRIMSSPVSIDRAKSTRFTDIFMVSSLQRKALAIRESKIVHKSLISHQLSRFVTEEAICLMYRISLQDIYVVECWRYVVYVHAQGVSKFVSYADFPPILGVTPPTTTNFIKWRKRWRQQHDYAYRKQAPQWWAEFFAQEFRQATSESVLYGWSKLLGLITFAFTEDTWQTLQASYYQEKLLLGSHAKTQRHTEKLSILA